MNEKTVTCATAQGPRNYQEDRYFTKRIEAANCHGWLLAVMDGHNGGAVADLCAKEINACFALESADRCEEALRNLVVALNKKTSWMSEGSTFSAVCVLESHNKAIVAVLGDSPVIIRDAEGALHVSPEHNVRTNLQERKAAEERGGMYLWGYVWNRSERDLQISRALGDAHLADILSREPEVYAINNPAWILVASDGIIDPEHADMEALAKDVAELAAQKASANDVLTWAAKRGLKDNATAIVWHASKNMQTE